MGVPVFEDSLESDEYGKALLEITDTAKPGVVKAVAQYLQVW